MTPEWPCWYLVGLYKM